MAEIRPAPVELVSAAFGIPEGEIMTAIRIEQLMATGGRSPRTAKVLVADVVKLFKVDVVEVFGLKE